MDITLDKEGNPIFPFVAKGVTIETLGQVVPGLSFHSEKYIFPVGYVAPQTTSFTGVGLRAPASTMPRLTLLRSVAIRVKF